MKIAVGTWGYRKWVEEGRCDIFGLLDEVAAIGAEGIEIFPRHVDRADSAQALADIKAACDGRGLGIASLICGNNFAAPRIADRAEQVANMARNIAEAAAVGIERLNCFTGYHTDGEDPHMELLRVVDCYREVVPLAEEHDVVLCLENHSSVCADADGLLWLLRAVGSPNLMMNPDPSNFVRGYTDVAPALREPIYTETEKVAILACNAHLKIRDFTPDGDHAHLDVPRLLGIYRKAGYNGWLVLEYHGKDDPHEPNAKGVALLKRLLGT